MPFEVMDPRGLSASSDLFHDLCFPAERQVGFWKPKITPDHYGVDQMILAPETKAVSSSPLEYHLPFGAESDERTTTKISWRLMEQNPSTMSSSNVHPSNFRLSGNTAEMSRIQNESSLFSSSLSEAYSRKLSLSENDLSINSIDTAVSNYEQDKPFESLKEMEAHTIGNLLPDEDDLLSGINDEIDFLTDPIDCGNLDDFDIFCNGGGMELNGENIFSTVRRHSGITEGQGSVHGVCPSEPPNGERPSRTLFVRNIGSSIEDNELRHIFEQYGDIRTLYTAYKHCGFAMVSYYDIRAAQNAMKVLHNMPLRSRKLDIHFSIPKDNPSDKEINQGTLVVFNHDYTISNDHFRRVFEIHGEIKEIRGMPHDLQYKLVEYYDVRAAEAALRALNSFGVTKKQIKPEPSLPNSRPCMVQCSQLGSQDESSEGRSPEFMVPFGEAAFKSSCVKSRTIQESHFMLPAQQFIGSTLSQQNFSDPNTLPLGMTVPRVSNPYATYESCHSQNKMNLGLPRSISTQITEGIENRHIRDLGLNSHSWELSGTGFDSLGKKNCPLHGHPYGLKTSNPYQYHPSSPMTLQNSPSLINGVQAHHQPQLPRYSDGPIRTINASPIMQNYQVESSGSIISSIRDRRVAYTRDAHGFHLGSPVNAGYPCNTTLNSLDNASQNMFPHVGMYSPESMYHIFSGRHQVMSVPATFESPNERVRFRRKDINSNHADRKQFELDVDRILNGEDRRTTLMLKNIPNKYTSKMLLASIDEYHQGTYDFIYLPIDFKNKCNVGYAFINMIDPLQIVPFYKTFNGKKWEKFNSEKVACLSYARIQGKASLVTHFQNSSLMNEDKRCRPILFHTDGPNAGDQEPFPMGSHIRSRYGKSHVFSREKYQVSSQNGEESSNETDSSSGSAQG